MKKNGFVFVESIVVLVIVALSLAMLLTSYSLVQRKTKEKEYYDKSSDKYLLYAISDLGTDDICSYSIRCKSGGVVEDTINFRADVEPKDKNGNDNPYYCKNTKLGRILYSCDEVLKSMQIRSVYVVKDVSAALRSNSATTIYDNGVIEYMKTLKKCNDVNTSGTAARNTSCDQPISYMIGVFERGNNDLYYASINLSGKVDEESKPKPETPTIELKDNEFLVTYFATGGSACDPASFTVTYDKPYGTLCETSRTGYTFKGWYLEPEYVYRVDASTIVKTARNHTLYAKWVDNIDPTCAITVTASGINMTYDDNVGVEEYGMINFNETRYNGILSYPIDEGNYYGYVKDAAGNTGTCIRMVKRITVNSNTTTKAFDACSSGNKEYGECRCYNTCCAQQDVCQSGCIGGGGVCYARWDLNGCSGSGWSIRNGRCEKTTTTYTCPDGYTNLNNAWCYNNN